MAVCQKWLSTITEKSSVLWSSRGKAEILEYLLFFFSQKRKRLESKDNEHDNFCPWLIMQYNHQKNNLNALSLFLVATWVGI